jgi:hypothetical protein
VRDVGRESFRQLLLELWSAGARRSSQEEGKASMATL